MRRNSLCLWSMLCALGGSSYAAADAAVPTASRYPVIAVDSLDLVGGEPLDLARLAQEDMERDRLELAPRYAVSKPVSISPVESGNWEDLGDGQMLWRLRVLGGFGTNSLNLGFSRFKLLPHQRLLLYSTDGSKVMRPFTGADNDEHGQLWTPIIKTADLIVELTVRRGEEATAGLVLGWINYGYRGFGTIPFSSYVKSGSCNLDVECLDPGDPWREEMRSVAVISTGGSTFCTGSLINNTANDHKMFFMTANHCGINAGTAASLVTFWNFQNSFCRTPGSPASGAAGDGSLSEFHTGSFFRSANSASDFTLVELDDPPVPAFDHFWAGWDRSTGDFTCTPGAPCSSIHHPNTDEKRITYVTTNTATTSNGGTTSPGDGSHVWAHWATDPPGPFTVPGVTEPGSSGSPLYTAAGRFIGQLHGGPSACGATGNNLSDYYGRFSVSWTGGGTNSTRLSNWLDAAATGVITVDGLAPCTAPGVPAIGTASATAPNQLQLTWADGAPPATAFNVYRAVGTCAVPGPFTLVGPGVAGSPYVDTAVSGGTTYAYHVTGLDSTGGCESAASACVQATATGACTLPPSFAGLAGVTNPASSTCSLQLSWPAAGANCGGPVTYNAYRSTTSGFVPGLGNQIASGLGGTVYLDSGSLVSGTPYFYVVRAVDSANSAEDTNTVQHSSAPTGPIASGNLTETFETAGGFDNAGWTHAALSDAQDWVWNVVAQSQTPTHSWFSDSLPSESDRVLVAPPFTAQAGSTLSFFHTFDFEFSSSRCFDGGTLELSSNGGPWTVMPDANFTAGLFNGTIDPDTDNPIAGKRAWCDGTVGTMTQVAVNLAPFNGQSLQLRWHAGDDLSIQNTGWFVDSVSLTNVGVAGSCTTSGPVGAGYFTVTPCRLVDTRDPNGPLAGPALQPASTRTFVLGGACGVPLTAKALAVNVTVVDATALGSLNIYAANQPASSTSVLNFNPGLTRANNAVTDLDPTGAAKVANNSAGTVHLILDVLGYFE